MEIERLIQEYTKKAKQLALRKSILCGVFFGFALDFVMALILWFVNVGVAIMLLLSLGVGLVGGIAAGTILYLKRFKPTTKSVAEMIDKLGLEERVITMYEMEHEDSNIAQLQRDDAKKKLSSVSPHQFRFQISKAAIVLLAVVATLGISMTTVSALSAAGVFQPGNEIVGPVDPNNPDNPTEEQTEYVEINYLASEGGTIQGETYQRIEKGKDATAVVAVADEGYSFAEWSDGVMTSERWDWNVMDNMTVTAIFLKNQTDSSAGEDGEEGEGSGEGEGEGEGQEEGEGEGSGEGQGEGGGESQGEGDGQGQGGEGQGDGQGDGQGGESEGDPEGELQGGGGASASGQLDDNTVIDGKTDYSDAVDYETEKENLENDDTLPPELKDALSGYLDGMKP